MQKYTNFNNVKNYALGGAQSLPSPTPGMVSCPSNQPYWTGSTCINCALPSYWDVLTMKCLQCPSGLIFDVQATVCTVPQANTLTYLSGQSRWVTSIGNMTKVLSDRAAKVANHDGRNIKISYAYY